MFTVLESMNRRSVAWPAGGVQFGLLGMFGGTTINYCRIHWLSTDKYGVPSWLIDWLIHYKHAALGWAMAGPPGLQRDSRGAWWTTPLWLSTNMSLAGTKGREGKTECRASISNYCTEKCCVWRPKFLHYMLVPKTVYLHTNNFSSFLAEVLAPSRRGSVQLQEWDK